jgi:hypothetical protein
MNMAEGLSENPKKKELGDPDNMPKMGFAQFISRIYGLKLENK